VASSPEWFREGHIWRALAPHPEDILIFKPSYGAFYDTPLETIRRNLGRDTTVIAGTFTNFCCGTTARQGYEPGFHVIVGSDITATDDADTRRPRIARAAKGLRPCDDSGGDRCRASLDGSRCPVLAESLYGWSLTLSTSPMPAESSTIEPARPVRAIRADGRAACQ
jgi:Isochorismatase family